MNEAAGAVTALYRARGFLVARAYLAPQDLDGGRLTITILEGRLGQVTVRSNTSRVSDERLLRTLRGAICTFGPACAEPIPLRSRSVERAALLVSEIPGVKSSYELTPGAAPGATDLVLDASAARRLQATAGFDNAGLAATGRYRGSLGFSLVNAAGYGDQLNFGATYAGKGLSSFAFEASVPAGYGGARAGVQAGRLRYALGGPFAILGATGAADSAGAFATRPLTRSLGSRADLRLDIWGRAIRSDLDSIDSRSRQRSAVASLALTGEQLDTLLRSGLTRYRLSTAYGTLQLRDPLSRAFDRATARTAGGFGKINLFVQREEVVAPGLTLFGQVTGQRAFANLDSSEKMPLGGVGAVRAFEAGAAAADTAAIATLEARVRLTPSRFGAWEVVAAPFYDHGWARLSQRPWAGYSGPSEAELGGGGVYVSLVRPGRFSVRASYARRASASAGLGGGDGDRVWLEAAGAF